MDVEPLLTPVSKATPAGPDLSEDLSFARLRKESEGEPERYVNGVTYPATPPQWPKVRDMAADVLAKSKDLRVAAVLTEALAATEGLGGLCAGLGIVRGLIEEYGEAAHPRLEEDGDSTLRSGAIELLDQDRVLRIVRRMALVESRRLGPASLVHVAVARGEPSPPDMALTVEDAEKVLAAAFTENTSEELRGVAGALSKTIDDAEAIEAAGHGARLPRLKALLAQALGAVSERTAPGLAKDEPEFSGQDPTPAGPSLGSRINTKQEVLAAIAAICQYYERHEPSSPVPLLLRRAERLVAKDFVEIIRDLSPESLDQIEKVAGLKLRE